jgi:DNA repair exonuclease SbcCD ATPase subunit
VEHDEGETPRPGTHRLPEERAIHEADEHAQPLPEARRVPIRPTSEADEPWPEARRVPIRPASSGSIIRHVPPRRSTDSSDLGYGDADREREREERLREIEGRIRQTEQTLTESEDQREAEFRRNEEERSRLFDESEQRREAEARQRIGRVTHPLEDHRPDTARGSSPTGAAADSASLAESVRQASQDASVRYATEILETVKSEREELSRLREEAAAERERMAAQLREEHEQATEAREARIRALEEELAVVKAELENERQLRITEEAETRERERQENLERDEAVRNQLGDITNLVQEQRDLCARKKELMDERWSEKQIRRQDKDNKLDELRELVNRVVQDREADRLRAEEERAAAEARPGSLVSIYTRSNLLTPE